MRQKDTKLVYTSVKQRGRLIFLKGRCKQYSFTMRIKIVPFENEAQRNEAYRVWVETYHQAKVRQLCRTKDSLE